MAGQYINYLLAFYAEKENRKMQRNTVRGAASALLLPNEEFLENYKISKEMVQYLCQELHQDLAPKHGTGLPVITKVLSSLRILISGHYQRGTGQEGCHSIGQRTVSKYVDQFVTAVNRRLKPQWISFPGTAEARSAVAMRFEQKSGLPDILGAIDCTHIKIFPPPRPTQAQFINRHGNTTINVQLVCDADAKILNVNANYPGRVHDQFIYNNSIIKQEMRRLYDARIGNYYLLGDSGYALEPSMMVPIRNAAPNTPEIRYTQWQCSARNVVERTNGYLKGTFRCLGIDRCLHYRPEKSSKIIYCCCTLYNIMKHFRLPMEYIPVGVEEDREDFFVPNARQLDIAIQKRQQIVATFFN